MPDKKAKGFIGTMAVGGISGVAATNKSRFDIFISCALVSLGLIRVLLLVVQTFRKGSFALHNKRRLMADILSGN